MINVVVGDILKSRSHALVNTVNCVGVMGKGIALAFKKRYPAMFDDYVARCERGEVKLGMPYPFETDDGRMVVNFPTKNHWRAVSRLDDIVEGLDYLQEHYEAWGVRSIAVPPLGCGNGQLEWSVVGPTLHRKLSSLEIPVDLYAPMGTPKSEMQLSFFAQDSIDALGEVSNTQQFVDPAWLAIVETLDRIEGRSYHWPVGRVRFQKIAYFLEARSVPLRLEHERGSYGPYSTKLKGVTSRLVNNGLIAERSKGNMIEVAVGQTFADARSAFSSNLDEWLPAIASVADLFARMDTDQTEIAASVHLVANELVQSLERTPSEIEVRDEVMPWKRRRRKPLEVRDVEESIANLATLGWLNVVPSPELHPDSDDDLIVVG